MQPLQAAAALSAWVWAPKVHSSAAFTTPHTRVTSHLLLLAHNSAMVPALLLKVCCRQTNAAALSMPILTLLLGIKLAAQL
jgi:hypothetical protein